MSLKAFLILCLLVIGMISVIAFFYWWVSRELDRDEATDERLDNDADKII